MILAAVFTFPVRGDDSAKTPVPPVAATIAEVAVPAQAAPAPATPAEPAPATATVQAAPASPPAPAPKAATPEVKKPVTGPLQIKMGDNISFRFGILLQPQAELLQNSAGGTGQNLLVRRARFLLGAQIAKNVFLFYETENSRLGQANAAGVKTISTGFQTLDAVVEWRFKKPFNLSGGLVRVPTSREALESSTNEFTIDFNTYAYTATGALAGTGGRDTGIMARGYLFKDRFEYRGGLFSGVRQAGSRNAFRKVARVQYNFFDTEVYGFPSYAGSNFGAKKILALGAGYDTQLDYRGKTIDLFGDFPTGFGSALGTVTWQNLDGGNTFRTTLGDSRIITVEGGLYFKRIKVGPWARYENRDFDVTNNRDEKKALFGVNYYPYGNNFNIKVAVARTSPAAGRDLNQFVIQLQAYYY
ncbi:MAG: hypothetical protein JJE51_05705 [Thermoanaerobaculia bacterium]|nr:hypothetical protein [Thermoanaerobaculia bacterium]